MSRKSTSSDAGGPRMGPRPYPAPTEMSDLLEAGAPRRSAGAPLYDTSDDDEALYGFDGVTAGREDDTALPRLSRGRTSGVAPPTRFLNDDDDDHVGPHGDDSEGGVKEGLFTACGLDKIGRYAVGVFLLVVVAMIWVAASEWIQHIYGALDFNKPYFITFFNTAMFSGYNLGYLFMPWWRAVPWAYPGEAQEEPFFTVPGRRLQEAEAAEAAAAAAEAEANMNTASTPREPEVIPPRYSRRELLRCAACFCPLWFLANVLFNYSLSATSVSSNTILSTTSSVWTLAFAKFILKAPTPLTKLGALVLTLGGTVMVAYGDDKSGGSDAGHDSLLGDILALVSAFFYAAYTTVLRYFLPDERRYSMPMVFGMVGVVNILLMWPGLIVLSVTGIEPYEWPSWNVLWPLAVNGLIGTNLSDVLWAKAVILTSPFVATLGLSLTTPFAMIADLVLHQTRYSGLYITGAIVVSAGFVVSNI